MIRQRTAAKINLSLLVGPTRPDGYHELLSVFAPVDLYDELEFALVAQPAQGEASLVRDAEAELVVVCPGCPGVAG
ncbi:MAG: hypothetical protein H5T84_04555, partial [Thermoleophilia bacterium]|nr:hypothetical protein [Thermoleophilia bacterium]